MDLTFSEQMRNKYQPKIVVQRAWVRYDPSRFTFVDRGVVMSVQNSVFRGSVGAQTLIWDRRPAVRQAVEVAIRTGRWVWAKREIGKQGRVSLMRRREINRLPDIIQIDPPNMSVEQTGVFHQTSWLNKAWTRNHARVIHQDGYWIRHSKSQKDGIIVNVALMLADQSHPVLIRVSGINSPAEGIEYVGYGKGIVRYDLVFGRIMRIHWPDEPAWARLPQRMRMKNCQYRPGRLPCDKYLTGPRIAEQRQRYIEKIGGGKRG